MAFVFSVFITVGGQVLPHLPEGSGVAFRCFIACPRLPSTGDLKYYNHSNHWFLNVCKKRARMFISGYKSHISDQKPKFGLNIFFKKGKTLKALKKLTLRSERFLMVPGVHGDGSWRFRLNLVRTSRTAASLLLIVLVKRHTHTLSHTDDPHMLTAGGYRWWRALESARHHPDQS